MENICLRRIGWRTWEMPEEMLLELLTPQAGCAFLRQKLFSSACLQFSNTIILFIQHFVPSLWRIAHYWGIFLWIKAGKGGMQRKSWFNARFLFLKQETSFLKQKSVFKLSGPQSRGKKRLKTMGLVMGDWCLYPQINGRIDFPLLE